MLELDLAVLVLSNTHARPRKERHVMKESREHASHLLLPRLLDRCAVVEGGADCDIEQHALHVRRAE